MLNGIEILPCCSTSFKKRKKKQTVLLADTNNSKLTKARDLTTLGVKLQKIGKQVDRKLES